MLKNPSGGNLGKRFKNTRRACSHELLGARKVLRHIPALFLQAVLSLSLGI